MIVFAKLPPELRGMSLDGKRVIPVVLCGGAGTRLWPVSREEMPKQFIPLIGDRSTFQQVMERTSKNLFDSPIVITNSDFRFIVAEQLRALKITADIVLEPAGRDSGPAVAVAAEIASLRDPEAIVLVLAADHVILDQEAFLTACRDAVPTAAAGRIVTFGVSPDHASEDYGYILPGQKLIEMESYVVKAFAEKPDARTGERYVTEGYLWNSGNFMFRADVMLSEIACYEPEIAAAAKDAVSQGEKDYDFFRLGAQAFARAPAKSIDHSVMERTNHAAVMPVDFGWSDVGNWSAVWGLLEQDREGNAVRGLAEFVNARDNLVCAEEGILAAVVGLDELIVVATADAVLVTSRNKSGDVKTLVKQLKLKGRPEVLNHRRVYRPWGHYHTVDAGARHQVKRIVVNPGATLSLQKHFHRAEHWVVVKGTAEITIERDVRTLYENESVYVPIGIVHRLANRGRIPLELVEVQVGSYLGEDDIVRLEDVYHRS
jgi:mannose-1-phosphate guanylyltransferase/mannose-6-phosphate isomerase